MGMWSRIRKTFRGDRHTAEIQEELQFHLDMDTAGGRDAREARMRLGNVTRIEEETRAMGIIEWLDSALQDARYGLRQLRKSPVLVTAVVLSLAIGVGANTAIFSLVDAAILRPLPVKDPDSLRIVEWINEGFPAGVTNINGGLKQLTGGRYQGTSVNANLYRRLAREQTGFRGADRGRGSGPGGDCRWRIAGGAGQAAMGQQQFLPGAGHIAGDRPALPRRGGPRGTGARGDREPSVLDEPFWKRRARRNTACASTTYPPASSAWPRPDFLDFAPANGPTSMRRSP